MNGPTIYGKLMQEATSEGIDSLRTQIEGRVAHTAAKLADDLAEIVRHAYIEGVRDGYVQGVAAGVASEQSSSKPEGETAA